MEEPTRAPVEAPTTSPDPDRERRVDPERLCPDQKDKVTRTIGPLLP